MIKVLRISSWPLLGLLALYLVTGFAMSGRYGLHVLLDAKLALAVHKLMHGPLLVLLPVHAICAIYLALRRWRWIKIRRR